MNSPMVLIGMLTNGHRVTIQHHRFPTNTEDPGAVVRDSDPRQASNHQTVSDVKSAPPLSLSTNGERKIDSASAAKRWDLNDTQNART